MDNLKALEDAKASLSHQLPVPLVIPENSFNLTSNRDFHACCSIISCVLLSARTCSQAHLCASSVDVLGLDLEHLPDNFLGLPPLEDSNDASNASASISATASSADGKSPAVGSSAKSPAASAESKAAEPGKRAMVSHSCQILQIATRTRVFVFDLDRFAHGLELRDSASASASSTAATVTTTSTAESSNLGLASDNRTTSLAAEAKSQSQSQQQQQQQSAEIVHFAKAMDELITAVFDNDRTVKIGKFADKCFPFCIVLIISFFFIDLFLI